MIAPIADDPPAALLFDLDGTLIDSVPDLARAVDCVLADLSHQPAGEERVRQWVGNGSRKLVQRALAWALDVSEESVGEAVVDSAQQGFMDHYQQCCTDRSRLYDGVLPALQHWYRHGVPMACVTNKPGRFTERLLDFFQLRTYLRFAISGDSLPTRKPDPAMLFAACERLGVDPAHAVLVGDSRNDVQAARAAGMRVACVSYGYNHGRPVAAEGPDWLVDSLLELV